MALGWLIIFFILAFIIGETFVLGIQFLLVDRDIKFGRRLNLGTLILGLISVPMALGIVFVRGP